MSFLCSDSPGFSSGISSDLVSYIKGDMLPFRSQRTEHNEAQEEILFGLGSYDNLPLISREQPWREYKQGCLEGSLRGCGLYACRLFSEVSEVKTLQGNHTGYRYPPT